jgi:hypothetical protein
MQIETLDTPTEKTKQLRVKERPVVKKVVDI